jgi:hypothetical protein
MNEKGRKPELIKEMYEQLQLKNINKWGYKNQATLNIYKKQQSTGKNQLTKVGKRLSCL